MIVRTGLLLTIALVILIMLGTRGFCVGSNASLRPADAADVTAPDLPAISMASTARQTDDADDLIDLYGNEVTAAVATYKFDSTGALYELHSPQTELPQLAVPKS